MSCKGALAGCGKTFSAQSNFDGLHVRGKPGLSCLFGLSRLFCLDQSNQMNQRDQTDRPTEQTK